MTLSMIRSVWSALFFVCLGSMQLRLTAAEDLLAWFEEFGSLCDRGPDALTNAYGKSMPQTCIDVPSEDDGETSERCFYTYVPESCSSDEISKAPLVVDVHGLASCGLVTSGYTGWMQIAEEECIVVVWPNGRENVPILGSCFSAPGFLEGTTTTTTPCCCPDPLFQPANEIIDTVYLKMAIDKTVESLLEDSVVSIDTDRIYMAGHSNGCMMSLAMAAYHSDTIAAVCCHAGALVTPFPEDYTPVPIWMVHGTEDPRIPYEGKPAPEGINPFTYLSVDNTKEILAEVNGCVEEEEVDLEDDGGVIGTISKKTNCKGNAAVEVVTIFGENHYPYKLLSGSNSKYDTTALAWEFCSSHSKAVVEEKEEVIEATTAPEEESDEPEVDSDSGEEEKDAAEESSSSTISKSFSMVLALPLFLLGAVGAV